MTPEILPRRRIAWKTAPLSPEFRAVPLKNQEKRRLKTEGSRKTTEIEPTEVNVRKMVQDSCIYSVTRCKGLCLPGHGVARARQQGFGLNRPGLAPTSIPAPAYYALYVRGCASCTTVAAVDGDRLRMDCKK